MCSIFGVFDIKTDAVELRKKALELSRLMRHNYCLAQRHLTANIA